MAVAIWIDNADELPEAVGDWCVFSHSTGTPLRLHSLSFGNGRSLTGTITLEDSSILSVLKATDTAPIVISTTAPHSLKTGAKVDISGCTGNTAANGDGWRIRILSDESFAIYRDSLSGNTDATQEIAYHQILPFGSVFTRDPTASTAAINVWQLRESINVENDLDWNDENVRPLLQFSWGGRIFVQTATDLVIRSVFADVYDEPKQLKFLNACMLSPKMAAVLVLPHVAPDPKKELYALQRTVLFGDSAPATRGVPRIVDVGGDSEFQYVIEKNHETLTYGLPSAAARPAITKADLYLLKYLITGITVYDASAAPLI